MKKELHPRVYRLYVAKIVNEIGIAKHVMLEMSIHAIC